MRGFSFKKVVLLLLAVLLVGSLNLASERVRGFSFRISYPFQRIFWSAGDSLSDFFGGMFNVVQLKKENDMLREKNLAFVQEIVQLEDTAKENRELREILGAEPLFEFDMVLASIVGREVGKDVLFINKGKKEGIAKDMPVITPGKVVVGRIVEVFDGFSSVLLVSQKDVSFDAGVIGKDIVGVIRGQGAGPLLFDLIPQQENLQEGDRVITSNLAKIFPKNLLVGIIEKVMQEDVEPFQKAKVRWLFNISSTENVLVIRNAELFEE